MLRQKRSWLWRYGAAVLSVALALLLSLFINPIRKNAPFAPFFAAAIVSVWSSGLGAGLVALALAILAINFFVLSPAFAILSSGAELLRLGIFVFMALLVILLISARQRAEAIVREQREWLHTALFSIGDAVLTTDPQGRVTFINAVAQTLTGWTQAEALGQPLTDVFRIINEQTRELGESPVARVMREGAVVGLANHTILIAKDGTARPIDDSGAPIRDEAGKITGAVLVFRDVTERRQTEEAMSRLAAIVESSDDAIIGKNLDGIIITWNAGAELIFGYSTAEVTGRPISILIPPGRPDEEPEILERLKGGERIDHYETVRIRKDGRQIDVSLTISPIKDAAGQIIGASKIARDITARKRAEAELQQQREWLRVTLSSIGDAVMATDASGRVAFVNPVAESITGWKQAEAEGRPLEEVFEIINEQTRQTVESPVAKVLREGAIVGLANHTVLITKDRTEIPIDDSGAPIRDAAGQVLGTVLVFRDVTERRRVEDAKRFLAEASAVLISSLDYEATLADLAQLIVPRLADWCSIDILKHGTIHRLAGAHQDPAKEELAREALRRYPPHPNDPDGVPQVLRTGQPLLIPEVPDSELADNAAHLKLLRELGLKSCMIVPLAAHGRTFGALTFLTGESGHRFNQTDLALAQDLAHRAALAIDNAQLYHEAQSANRIKDEFLATVSHELRTPLNAMLGWTHLLGSGKLDPSTFTRAIETIGRNARAQAQIVDDLLDVSRIITGKLRIQISQVELSPVIEAALDTVRPAAEAKHIQLVFTADAEVGPVSGDPNRLQQIVWNLLSNAIKFTPSGGRVEVGLERLDSYIQIQVRDTGQGIGAEFLPYVFDRFRQADSTSTRSHGGLGLGLAIARHLVELHGGTIWAESQGEGQGSIFTVKLPARAVRLEASAESAVRPGAVLSLPGEPELDSLLQLEGVRVLVVDDEADAREIISAVLQQAGAEVITAASSAEALEALARWQPEVLVSDLGLPGEDGYALIEQVRRLGAEQGGQTPAVALTAYARAEDRVRALSAGYQMHVPKPIEPNELVTVVASLIHRIRKRWGAHSDK